jgi:transposase
MARPRKHRHWSAEEKRAICCQTRAPGISVAQVARRYALNANLIFKWLKDPRYAPGDTTSDTQAFLPVEISTQASADLVPVIDVGSAAASGGDRGQVEIILPDGIRLKVDGGFDGGKLARLIKGLMA